MTATGVQFTAFLNMISDRRLSLPSMDGNGSGTHGNGFEYLFFCFLSLSTFFVHFPPSMIKTDRIRMKTNSDICLLVSFRFPSLRMCWNFAHLWLIQENSKVTCGRLL